MIFVISMQGCVDESHAGNDLSARTGRAAASHAGYNLPRARQTLFFPYPLA